MSDGRQDVQSARGRDHRMGGLAKFGVGRVVAEQKEELRRTLLHELREKGLAQGSNPSAAVQEEVDKFLQNGHISDSNISRLERRVLRRSANLAGPASAREQRPGTLEFSPCSQSAGSRTPRQAAVQRPGSSLAVAQRPGSSLAGARRPAAESSVAAVQRPGSSLAAAQRPGSSLSMSGRPASCCGSYANPKWSEVGVYFRQVEVKEKEEKREVVRVRQQQMRQELQDQMHEKELQKSVRVEEEKTIFERQKVELCAWREAEGAIVEEQKRIALEVRQEREVQNLVVHNLKDNELKLRSLEDDEHLKNAAVLLDQEKKMALDKKIAQRNVMQQLMAEWTEDRKNRAAQQKLRAAHEQEEVEEYQKVLDKQQGHFKRSKEPARTGTEDYVPPNKADRRKKEILQEKEALVIMEMENAKATEAEREKLQKRNRDRDAHRDFLNQQMAEHERKKQVRLDELKEQKESVQAGIVEFKELEKQRSVQEKQKNLQYRKDLEQQIETRKASTKAQKKRSEDLMSAAEVAMNRGLLDKARSMRSTFSSQAPESTHRSS